LGALVAPIQFVIVRVVLDVYLGIMLIMGLQGDMQSGPNARVAGGGWGFSATLICPGRFSW
jgi:hypothetical protein